MSSLEKALIALSLIGVVLLGLLLLAVNRVAGGPPRPDPPTVGPPAVEEASSLVGQWVAEDWLGGTLDWTDRVALLNATVSSPSVAPARVDDAITGADGSVGIVFDGVDDFFAVAPDQNPLRGARRVTIVAFFEATSGQTAGDGDLWPTNAGPIQGGSSATREDWGLAYDRAGFAQGFFTTEVQLDMLTNLLDGRAHTVAMTWESISVGGDGMARLYVDGSMIGRTEPSRQDGIGNSSGFLFGAASTLDCCAASDLDRFFSGTLGEIRLYDAVEDPALVHAEIVGAAPITGRATDVTSGAATLTGVAHPNAVLGSFAYFRFGSDPQLETATETTDPQPVAGVTSMELGVTVGGLEANSRYFYRLEMRTGDRTIVGRTRDLLIGSEIRLTTDSGENISSSAAAASFLAAAGEEAAPRSFTITNTGDLDLRDLRVDLVGRDADSFTITRPGRTLLEPGAETSFQLGFTPPRPGSFAAAVEIHSNAAGADSPFVVPLAGKGAVVWAGPPVTFSNPCAECAVDRLTENVAITRGESSGIFNSVTETESAGKQGPSPVDTEWAYGTTAQLGTLTFQPWFEWLGFKSPARAIGQDAVLHLISDDIYIDIRFVSWVDGGGGGFSYSRTTPAE